MAPMDVVQAEAEEATRQQALTTATATMRTAELSLKRLIVSGTNDPLWSQHIEPTDRPDFQTGVDRRRRRGAVGASAAHRPADRAQRVRVEQRAAEIAARSVAARRRRARHLRRVRPRRRRSRTSTGRGLDRSRAAASPSTAGTTTRCGTLFDREYPNWQFALNVNYPIGGNNFEAQAARTRLLIQQNQAQIRASELTVATEVTNAALQVTNSIEALAAARAARDLSQRRLDAEMSRFDVGMSNNYQVVQIAARPARSAELRTARAAQLSESSCRVRPRAAGRRALGRGHPDSYA